MTDRSITAFQPLEVRAAAQPIEGLHDRLSLRDHIVSVEIGAFQAERDMTQRLAFDVVVEVAAPDADLDDDVDQILSYDRLTWAIEHELAAERLNLLETLAERIADRILQEPQSLRVFIRIQKLDKGNGKLGVEMVREPGAKQDAKTATLAPTVAFVGQAALGHAGLPAALAILRDKTPLVLVLDVPSDQPTAKTETAQKQIALLSVEQAAWQLSSQLADFDVVATRTELDWAIKTGRPCIWAPARLVNDATDLPEISGPAMALWFARQWGTERLIDIGGTLPDDHTIPVQTVTL